ncbi:recombinase family protein [Streptomyces niveus]|uniref:recombinase family protein n=1 Tax=Streptomyces niveus TaxID=193462 RepID=UPI0036B393C6
MVTVVGASPAPTTQSTRQSASGRYDEVRVMLAADRTLKCVVAYARISFDGRVKDAHGVEDQHRDMTDDARRLGWMIAYRYTDNDKSASKETVIRDDFEQLIADLAAGATPEGYPIHGVMAVNDDRLYRRPSDWERYLKAFTSKEGRVYHDSNGVQDLYAEGFEIKGLVGVAMSLSETRKKQRRSRNSHRSRAVRGQSTSAWRPFGWDDDKVTLRPQEADAIRKAVHDVIAGALVSEITLRWKEAEFITSRGNLFQYATVKQVLTNARLCGYREIKGELVRDGDDQPIVGEWDSIITPKEWYAVTATIKERGRGRVCHAVGWCTSTYSPAFSAAAMCWMTAPPATQDDRHQGERLAQVPPCLHVQEDRGRWLQQDVQAGRQDGQDHRRAGHGQVGGRRRRRCPRRARLGQSRSVGTRSRQPQGAGAPLA